MTRRLLGVAATIATTLVVAGCDSSPAAPASTPTPTTAVIAGPTAIDPCLVATWKSTGISGTITIGGAKVAITGGVGEVLTIGAGGTIKTDETNTTPVKGSAADGTQYTLLQTGTATGKIASSAEKISVTLDQPTTLTVALLKNGVQVQSQHPGSASDSYTCSAGTSLTITGGGGTVSRYSPG